MKKKKPVVWLFSFIKQKNIEGEQKKQQVKNPIIGIFWNQYQEEEEEKREMVYRSIYPA